MARTNEQLKPEARLPRSSSSGSFRSANKGSANGAPTTKRKKRAGSSLIYKIEAVIGYLLAHGFIQICLVFALSYLSCRTPADKAVPKLIKKLSAADSKTRNEAALQLAPYGEEAEPAVPALIHLLKDPNSGVRTSAAFALRKIGSEEAERALDQYEK